MYLAAWELSVGSPVDAVGGGAAEDIETVELHLLDGEAFANGGDDGAGASGVDLALEEMAHRFVQEAVETVDGVERLDRGREGAKRLGPVGVVVITEAAAARGGHGAGAAGRQGVGAEENSFWFH